MHYTFLDTASEADTKKFLRHITANLHRVRQFGWLPLMRDRWLVGQKKATERLDILNFKTKTPQ